MSNSNKILVGIRASKLSVAQTEMFINDVYKQKNIKNNYEFEIKTIKTTGDIYKNDRLDRIGGKGLFLKEIEEHILDNQVDIGIHSMKDVPAVDVNKNLEIICWVKRTYKNDALISNSGKGFFDLPSGAVLGTSSIRRRAQILNLRKDLNIKLLRGNVDTRINKLRKGQFDAIILSLAGIKKLNLDDQITEVLDLEYFLPAACQGAVGVQAKRNSKFRKLFDDINDLKTEIECISERNILNIIGASCNSPVSVEANIDKEELTINVELFNHSGKKIYKEKFIDRKENYIQLTSSIGKNILDSVGKDAIYQLGELKDDFDYKAKSRV